MNRYALGALVVLTATGFGIAAEPELHVVVAHVGHNVQRRSAPGTASVKVDRPGQEVVLVISGYNPVTWDVQVTPKTTLTRVLALGYHRQSVTAPKGIPVEELTHDGVSDGVCKEYIYCDYNIEAARFRRFVQALHVRTKLEIVSFQGVYQFDPDKPFVVDAIQKDERLSSDFPKVTPAAQLPKIKFDAVRVTAAGHFEIGTFTEKGPNNDDFAPLPKGVRLLAHDPNGKWHYGLGSHDLHSVNLNDRTSNKIPRPDDKFAWPRAMTFDAKRDRAVFVASAGLYEYVTKGGGKWAQLTNERGKQDAAIVWHAKTDTLFTFGSHSSPKDSEVFVPTLTERNANGAVVGTTTLGSPMFPGLIGRWTPSTHAQLIDLGTELALLVHTSNRDSETGRSVKSEGFLYVIEPKNGKVKLAWKE